MLYEYGCGLGIKQLYTGGISMFKNIGGAGGIVMT
jgi:hypothetical protein